jgi:hypothetical protein
MVMQRMTEFPGAGTARKMLTIAASMRGITMENLNAPAGALGDLFFMKYRLEHYDVPPEFAELRTGSWRVFDDDEGNRVAQIMLPAHRMQFFLFPAARNPKDAKPMEFKGWRYIEHEGWSGAVQEKAGICFMAATRGDRKVLEAFVAGQPIASPTPTAAPSPVR